MTQTEYPLPYAGHDLTGRGALVTGATIVVSIVSNMAVGFLCGLVVSGVLKRISRRVKAA